VEQKREEVHCIRVPRRLGIMYPKVVELHVFFRITDVAGQKSVDPIPQEDEESGH